MYLSWSHATVLTMSFGTLEPLADAAAEPDSTIRGIPKINRQKVSLQPALEHCIPKTQRCLPKVRWHQAFPLVASPCIVDKDVEPALLLANPQEERLYLELVCVITAQGNALPAPSSHFLR